MKEQLHHLEMQSVVLEFLQEDLVSVAVVVGDLDMTSTEVAQQVTSTLYFVLEVTQDAVCLAGGILTEIAYSVPSVVQSSAPASR